MTSFSAKPLVAAAAANPQTGATDNAVSKDHVVQIDTKSQPSVTSASDDHDHDISHFIIPTEEEKATLRKVVGRLPISAYLMCGVEFAERTSYLGCVQVFKNYIRAPLPEGGNGAGAPPRGSELTAGALGRGSVVASAMSDSFTFLAYALPILGGWLADAKLGRFKTICIGALICGVAHFIMVMGALPSVLQAGNGMAPFAISLYLLALGTGFIKANVSSSVLDQNPHKVQHIITTKKGERVIVDPEATSASAMMTYYWIICVGANIGIATSYLAKLVGFWAAYLLPLVIYLLLPGFLWYSSSRTIKVAPNGSDLTAVVKVLGVAFKNGGLKKIGRAGFWDAARPAVLAAQGKTCDWDDQFVTDLAGCIRACCVFLFLPIANINDGGLGAAANAQSAAMTTQGIPNDLLNNLATITIIVSIPLLEYVVYPILSHFKIQFGPIRRIFVGFLFASIGSAGWAIIQYYVYETSPCGYAASTCTIDPFVSPISIWWTAIPTILTALYESFGSTTVYALAYTRSPKNLKGVVVAFLLFTTAISSAISLGTAEVIQDPHLIWAFAVPSVIGFLMAIAFYAIYRDLDKENVVIKNNNS